MLERSIIVSQNAIENYLKGELQWYQSLHFANLMGLIVNEQVLSSTPNAIVQQYIGWILNNNVFMEKRKKTEQQAFLKKIPCYSSTQATKESTK